MKNTNMVLFAMMFSSSLSLFGSDVEPSVSRLNSKENLMQTFTQDDMDTVLQYQMQTMHKKQAQRLGYASAASIALLGASVYLQKNGSSVAQDPKFAQAQLAIAGSAVTTTGLAAQQAYQAGMFPSLSSLPSYSSLSLSSLSSWLPSWNKAEVKPTEWLPSWNKAEVKPTEANGNQS